jgi:redox-sensing transcriptional repressor
MQKPIIAVPEPTLRRLPLYYHYLKSVAARGREFISCTHIGKDLNLDSTQVRKDLAFTGIRGLPKVGYKIEVLINSIEEFFGYNRIDEAFLIGVGNLGKALLGYKGFDHYGFKIIAAFDSDEQVIGRDIHGVTVLPMSKLENLCKRMQVKIAVLTVPETAAQQVTDILVKDGIKGIWNFAPVSLKVPQDVLVENETIAAGLAVLTRKLQTSSQISS